jgi:hypothetical protein
MKLPPDEPDGGEFAEVMAIGIAFVVAVLLVLGGGVAFVVPGGAAEPAKPAKVELLPTEADAVGWAFEALLRYPEADQPYVRFVWLPPYSDPEWIGLVDFAVNSACSQTTTLVRGDKHAGGWLLGYNLRLLAPEPTQLARLVAEWDALAARDSRFHVPEINLVGTGAVLAPHLQTALARHATDETKSERIDVLLVQMSQSTGAIYPADFLIEQLLTSARGRYPEFRQIDFTKTLGDHLAKRGFFLGESKNLRGEKGAILLASDVTGKGRAVLTAYGVASRLPVAVTFDLKDATTRPEAQFIRNLIEFRADASEALVPLPNGLWEGVLADGAGNLQRVAPPDVVADSTKPAGHTQELEMGMSCVLCHATDNGYRTARNDLELLQGADADYFGDEITYRGKTLTRAEAVAIVAGRYGERIDEPDGVLGRARRDYIRKVDELTDYEITADGPTSVQQLGAKLKAVYHAYRYQRIDAERACLELGVRIPAERARATLRQLAPAPEAGRAEDIVIALLKNGASVRRDDFDAIYSELARRAVETRPALVVE